MWVTVLAIAVLLVAAFIGIMASVSMDDFFEFFMSMFVGSVVAFFVWLILGNATYVDHTSKTVELVALEGDTYVAIDDEQYLFWTKDGDTLTFRTQDLEDTVINTGKAKAVITTQCTEAWPSMCDRIVLELTTPNDSVAKNYEVVVD